MLFRLHQLPVQETKTRASRRTEITSTFSLATKYAGIRSPIIHTKRFMWANPPFTEGAGLLREDEITVVNPDQEAEIGFINLMFADDLVFSNGQFIPIYIASSRGVKVCSQLDIDVFPKDKTSFANGTKEEPFATSIRSALPNSVYASREVNAGKRYIPASHIQIMKETFNIANPAEWGALIQTVVETPKEIIFERPTAIEELLSSELLTSNQLVRENLERILGDFVEKFVPKWAKPQVKAAGIKLSYS